MTTWTLQVYNFTGQDTADISIGFEMDSYRYTSFISIPKADTRRDHQEYILPVSANSFLMVIKESPQIKYFPIKKPSDTKNSVQVFLISSPDYFGTDIPVDGYIIYSDTYELYTSSSLPDNSLVIGIDSVDPTLDKLYTSIGDKPTEESINYTNIIATVTIIVALLLIVLLFVKT